MCTYCRWTCCTKPGAICCLWMTTPWPPHWLHRVTSSLESAPCPRQWLHSFWFTTSTCVWRAGTPNSISHAGKHKSPSPAPTHPPTPPYHTCNGVLQAPHPSPSPAPHKHTPLRFCPCIDPPASQGGQGLSSVPSASAACRRRRRPQRTWSVAIHMHERHSKCRGDH